MVMKKLYLRMLRELKTTKGQFFSIVLIIAVGSALFAGMFAGNLSISQSLDKYYSSQNFADMWVYFKGISNGKLKNLSDEDGIIKAEGRYTYNAELSINGKDSTIRIHSFTSEINKTVLTKGKMPQNCNEIIVDYKYAEANKLSVGNKLKIPLEDGTSKYLKITGFCMNPEYAFKQKDAATLLTTQQAFGVAYAQKDTVISLNKTTTAYQTLLKKTNEELESAQTKIDSAQAQLVTAQNDYKDKKALAQKSLDNAVKKLNETKDNLDKAQSELNKQEKDAQATFDETQAKIESSQKQLNSTKSQLDASHANYLLIRNSLSAEEQQSQDSSFEQQYNQLQTQTNDLAAKQQNLNLQKSQSESTFSEKQATINNGYEKYNASVSEYYKQQKSTNEQLEKASDELKDKQNQLNESKTELSNKKADAESNVEEVAEYYQEVLIKTNDISATEKSLKKMDSYVASVKREDQPSFKMVNGSLEPIQKISYIFPLIFFLVAAVIAFISMSKAVENQRQQIAIMQAMGISKWSIRFSFLSYAFTASLLGSLPFALIGNLVIPKILGAVFTNRYELPYINIQIYPKYIFLTLILGFAFCGISTLLALQKVLKETPAQAIRPRPPKNSKKILIERFDPLWRRLKYSNKLVLRNIFLNKSRVLLSSIGIIGSVMLLIAGLSLKNSAQNVIDTTIDSMSYDMSIVYNKPVENKNDLGIKTSIKKAELTSSTQAVLKLKDNVDITLQQVESNSTLLNLYDSDGNKIEMNKKSVVIPKIVADDYGISVGDTVKVTLSGKTYMLKVAGICKEYISKTLYISFDAAKASGINIESDTVLVKLNDPSKLNHTVKELIKKDNVKAVNTKNDMIALSKEMLKTMNTVILIIVVSAAILAVSVIYNITSINIFERTRDYATLMVLGYYKKEVNNMIFTENLMLAAFGSLVGIPFGAILFNYLSETISRDNLRLPDEMSVLVVLLAIAITFIFSICANLILKTKIKRIVMTEALKSVE